MQSASQNPQCQSYICRQNWMSALKATPAISQRTKSSCESVKWILLEKAHTQTIYHIIHSKRPTENLAGRNVSTSFHTRKYRIHVWQWKETILQTHKNIPFSASCKTLRSSKGIWSQERSKGGMEVWLTRSRMKRVKLSRRSTKCKAVG